MRIRYIVSAFLPAIFLFSVQVFAESSSKAKELARQAVVSENHRKLSGFAF